MFLFLRNPWFAGLSRFGLVELASQSLGTIFENIWVRGRFWPTLFEFWQFGMNLLTFQYFTCYQIIFSHNKIMNNCFSKHYMVRVLVLSFDTWIFWFSQNPHWTTWFRRGGFVSDGPPGSALLPVGLGEGAPGSLGLPQLRPRQRWSFELFKIIETILNFWNVSFWISAY